MAFEGINVEAQGTNMVILSLPVPPPTNKRKKATKCKRTDPAKIAKKGLYYAGIRTTHVVKDYQEQVREIVKKRKIRPLTGNVSVLITWYRQAKRGDIVDRWKDLCDALQAKFVFKRKTYVGDYGVYVDDSQIARFYVERNDTDPKHPRVVVQVVEERQENGKD
jgi:Holliday junction resolvase RusA-like endonuclease